MRGQYSIQHFRHGSTLEWIRRGNHAIKRLLASHVFFSDDVFAHNRWHFIVLALIAWRGFVFYFNLHMYNIRLSFNNGCRCTRTHAGLQNLLSCFFLSIPHVPNTFHFHWIADHMHYTSVRVPSLHDPLVALRHTKSLLSHSLLVGAQCPVEFVPLARVLQNQRHLRIGQKIH